MQEKFKDENIQKRIDLSRYRTDKLQYRLTKEYDAGLVADLFDLANYAEKLLKENAILRENIFNIEQSVAPEQRWENIIAAKLQRALDKQDKQNYLEITSSVTGEAWIITLQKKYGKTPEQLKEQADAWRIKAENKVENLRKELETQNKNVRSLIAENKALALIKEITYSNNSTFGSNLKKSEEDLKLAIKKMNTFISTYNRDMFRFQFTELHSSMRSAFSEAWSRQSLERSKVLALEKQLQVRNARLNKKKFFSKFKKYIKA